MFHDKISTNAMWPDPRTCDLVNTRRMSHPTELPGPAFFAVHLMVSLDPLSSEAGRVSLIGCESAWYADSRGFDPHVRQNIPSLKFGHETISSTILSFPLIYVCWKHSYSKLSQIILT